MASQAIQNRQENPLVAFNNQIASRADQFKMALPSHITPEKFQRTILTAVQNDPELLNADRQSLILACMRAAQDGLLPDKREAALVIFRENKNINGTWETRLLVQYMPMVYGLRKKILQSGAIADITTNVVYRQEIEAGCFVYEEGTERMLRHKPLLDPNFDPTDDDLACAYSIATFKDGTMSFEVMRASEIRKVQEKSQTGATRDRKGQPRKPSGPWVEWKSEQWRKTVMRRHSKSLPMSGDLIDIEARDDDMAARSTENLLAAPAAAVVAAMPTRAQVADMVDVQTPAIEHESVYDDGVVTTVAAEAQPEPVAAVETVKKPAKTKQEPAPEPAAEPEPADDNGAMLEQTDNQILRGMADSLIERIGRADTVIAVKNLKNTMPAEMPEEMAAEVEKAAADRDAELRKPR